jgi:hypothetical protein
MTNLEQIRDAISFFDLDGAGPDYDANLLKAARAAVEALRDLGEGIVQIYDDIACDGFSPESSLNLTAFGIMLDAILNEKSE